MRLLVGLGNPGNEYEGTRHNVGFVVVDAVASVLGIANWKEFKGGLLAKHGEILLFKPQIYMNRSGTPIRQVVDYYDIALENVCIVADDVYLPPGTTRIRHEGSDGGHNGWKSVLENLEGAFRRVRVGVGIYEQDPQKRIQQPALDRYVLQRPSADDQKAVTEMVDSLVPNLIEWLEHGNLSEETRHI